MLLEIAGLSVHDAKIEPAITILAPALIAFAISPLYFIPPSAIGISFSLTPHSPEYRSDSSEHK